MSDVRFDVGRVVTAAPNSRSKPGVERDPVAILRGHGIDADPAGERRLRSAVSRLGGALDDDERVRAELDGGNALLAMAAAGHADRVRAALSPDPTNANTTWTVCCYQVGDLTPSAMQDFPDPIAALAWLAFCDEPAHLAGELVASTATGLRWTALIRANHQVRFRLLSTATGQDDDAGLTLAAAERAWTAHVASWADASPARQTVVAAVTPAPARQPTPDPVQTSSAAAPEPAIGVRLDAIEAAIRELGVSNGKAFRRHRLAAEDVDQRLQEVEAVVAELGSRLGAMESAIETASAPTRVLASCIRRYRTWSATLT